MEQINNCIGKDCSRCGECCAFGIPITRHEEKKIREYIKKNDIQKENLFNGNDFYCRCCFFDEKNHLCKIYPVRPNICKSYKCNRNENELEKEKIQNHERAYWNHMDDKNGKIKHFTSFDLLFYNDARPILTLLIDNFSDENGNLTIENYRKMKKMMFEIGLEELANSLSVEEGK